MDCKECSSLLSEFQTNELDKTKSREVEEHLSACIECAKEFESYNRLDELVKGLPRYIPSEDAVLSLKSFIAHAGPASRGRTEFGAVMDSEELAEFLRVSMDILEQYIEEIPCFELGGKLLFRKESIEQWIAERERDFGFQKLESEVNRILLSKDFS
jgi:hypothetical protein